MRPYLLCVWHSTQSNHQFLFFSKCLVRCFLLSIQNTMKADISWLSLYFYGQLHNNNLAVHEIEKNINILISKLLSFSTCGIHVIFVVLSVEIQTTSVYTVYMYLVSSTSTVVLLASPNIISSSKFPHILFKK